MATHSATGMLIDDGVTKNVDPGATVSKGGVHEFTDHIGVYQEDGVSGDSIAVRCTGAFTLTKETGVAFTDGQRLFWDSVNDRLDATNTNIPAGVARGAAASGDVLADVILVMGMDGS